LVTALLLAAPVLAQAPAPAPGTAPAPALWVYTPINFQVNEAVDRLHALLQRARDAGYTAAVVTDYKFGNLRDRPGHYFKNIARTVEHARGLGVELIPCVMPMGYSSSLLQNDPDLAEGLPVRGCEFIAQAGQAQAADRANLLPGGGFDKADRQKPAGWDWIDGWGASATLDAQVKRSGASSLRMAEMHRVPDQANSRVVRKLELKPFHQYRLSLWARTESLENAPEFRATVLAEGRSLNHANLGLKPTQDWTLHEIAFNSLEHTQASLYLGIWGVRPGRLWLDDVSLRVAGGVNLIRREGCPLTVADTATGQPYEEGRDFEPWNNPQTGRLPWPGEFAAATAEPPIRLKPGGRITPGTRLKVSYSHAQTVYDGQVASCLTHPRVYELMRDEVAGVKRLLAPKRYMMQHDELRLANQCDLCQSRGLSAGALLADNVKRCAAIIREADPAAGVLVWSDMFDPHHNAVNGYYLVRGTLAGAWEGLDPAITPVNWNHGKAVDSLRFFDQRGHAQVVAGFYDHAGVEAHHATWARAAEGLKAPGVRAWIYTTWNGDYAHLERYAKAVRGR
jgi:hypothetical protein